MLTGAGKLCYKFPRFPIPGSLNGDLRVIKQNASDLGLAQMKILLIKGHAYVPSSQVFPPSSNVARLVSTGVWRLSIPIPFFDFN